MVMVKNVQEVVPLVPTGSRNRSDPPPASGSRDRFPPTYRWGEREPPGRGSEGTDPRTGGSRSPGLAKKRT